MWSILLPLLSTLLGAGVRHWFGERTWTKVRSVARSMAADPAATNDPQQAVRDALNQVLLDRLAAEAERVKDAFVVNGSNPYSKVKR